MARVIYGVKFKILDKALLKCINTGFDNLKLVEYVNKTATNEERRRHLVNKLRMLANLIDNGMVLPDE